MSTGIPFKLPSLLNFMTSIVDISFLKIHQPMSQNIGYILCHTACCCLPCSTQTCSIPAVSYSAVHKHAPCFFSDPEVHKHTTHWQFLSPWYSSIQHIHHLCGVFPCYKNAPEAGADKYENKKIKNFIFISLSQLSSHWSPSHRSLLLNICA